MNEEADHSIQGRLEFLNERRLPALVTAAPGESLGELLAVFREPLEAVQLKYGAILFRGFGLATAEQFGEVAGKLFGDSLKPYLGGTSPRGQVDARVYESTWFPRRLRLPLHNEMSYLPDPPRRIAFFCEIAPKVGGETPLADSREIYQRVPLAVREAFESRGIRYHRYLYGPKWNLFSAGVNRLAPLHRSWMAAFQTGDRAEVERVCREQGVSIEWDREEGARIANSLPAVRKHPFTEEKIWFNQATAFVPTPHATGFARWLLYRLVWPDAMRRPFHAAFATGEEITGAQLNDVNDAIENSTIRFRWRRGDLLLLDNYLVAHGRMPFRGQRRILVAMS
jgi:alpha-ketoglutarate-dependent taurine dioxygenase